MTDLVRAAAETILIYRSCQTHFFFFFSLSINPAVQPRKTKHSFPITAHFSSPLQLPHVYFASIPDNGMHDIESKDSVVQVFERRRRNFVPPVSRVVTLKF